MSFGIKNANAEIGSGRLLSTTARPLRNNHWCFGEAQVSARALREFLSRRSRVHFPIGKSVPPVPTICRRLSLQERPRSFSVLAFPTVSLSTLDSRLRDKLGENAG